MAELEIDFNRNLIYEEIYTALKKAIIAGELRPGERLIEQKLASAMGISRTPLREAIYMLKLDGLVYANKRKGAIVAECSLKDIEDLYGLRIVLEKYAAKLACININSEQLNMLETVIKNTVQCMSIDDFNKIIELNTEFHDIIAKASKNNRLVSTLNNLRENIYRYRKATIYNKEEAEKSLEGHVKIFEALKNKNIDQIEYITENYILSAKEAVIKKLKAKHI